MEKDPEKEGVTDIKAEDEEVRKSMAAEPVLGENKTDSLRQEDGKEKKCKHKGKKDCKEQGKPETTEAKDKDHIPSKKRDLSAIITTPFLLHKL